MLIEALNSIVASAEASFTLYALKVTTSRITATQIRIQGNELAVFSKECLTYLKDKQYSQKEIRAYPCGKPKDHIETVDVTSDMVAERYSQLLAAVASPETNNTDISKYGAYVIVSTIGDQRTYFINMKKPLRNFKHSTFFGIPTEANNYKRVNNQLLNLTYHFDCIIHVNTCYFITMNAEPVFNLQQYHARQTATCQELLLEKQVIQASDQEKIVEYLKKPGKYRALCDFNEERINIFSAVDSSNKDEYERKYKLSFLVNPDGSCCVDVSTEDKLRAFIATITLKRAKDFDDIIVESPSPFRPVNQ